MEYRFLSILKFFSISFIFFSILISQNCGQLQSVVLNSSSEDIEFSKIEDPSFFTCKDNDTRAPNTSPFKRLNKFEIQNSIYDIFSTYLVQSQLDQLMSEVTPLIDEIPNEFSDEGLDLFDQSLSEIHIEGMINVAEAVGAFVMSSAQLRTAVLGPCSNQLNDVNCMSSFIQSFGKLVFRGQFSVEDASWYSSVFQAELGDYESLIATLFSSPKFIYHLEVGSSDLNNGEVLLTSFEKASRLSYFLTQSTSDNDLLLAAESDGALTDQEIKDQTERLINLPLTKSRLTIALANQIFKTSHTHDFRDDVNSLNSMFAELGNLTSPANLKQSMIQEVYDYLHYVMWEINGGYEELMTLDYVFPRTTDLAEIYGTQIWNGSFAQASLVRSPSAERTGILTRAQQLISGYGSTSLIHRGVKVYNDFLCGSLPAPADTGAPDDAVILDTHSGREYVESITEIPGTSCIGCHKSLINPFGFVFEGFDPLGRYRLEEDIYYPEESDNSGQILTVKPVRSNTQAFLGDEIINATLSGSRELNLNLAVSPRAVACFNSNLWSFANKQLYRIGQNDCATRNLYKQMISTGSIVETIKYIPTQPEFFKRKL